MGQCKKDRWYSNKSFNKKDGIVKTFDKRFTIPLNFYVFNHPVYPHELKNDLIVRLELNSSEKMIFCSGDTTATYKISDITLEYDSIFDERVVQQR